MGEETTTPNVSNSSIRLGVHATDELTGFSGYITKIQNHIAGCTRVELTAEGTETRSGESVKFYEEQLSIDVTIESDPLDVDPTTEMDIPMGSYVRETVTGVEGVVVIQQFEYLNCPSVGIQQVGDAFDGNKAFLFDVPQVEVIEEMRHDFDMDDENTSDTGAVDASEMSVVESFTEFQNR